MALLDPFKTFWSSLLSLLQSQYSYLVLGLLGLLVIALVTYGLGWGTALLASPWLWVLVAVLLAGGIFATFRWGLPWLRERRFLRRAGSEHLAAGQESPEEFRAKFAYAVQTLKNLPQLRGKLDPLYALPWYLLIGEGQSGKTAALQGADLFSPLTPLSSTDGATQNFDWWVSNDAIILDTAGRYCIPVDIARDRAEWYRLLRLIHYYREQEPINGLVITVSVDVLVSRSEEQLRADANKLRERTEEAVRELGVDFPVYLLVTKCDLIEGCSEFFALLPERVRSEVIGYVDDPPPPLHNGDRPRRGAGTLQRFATGLQTIYDRLHLFRLALLSDKTPDTVRQAVFCFPEEFKALQPPLSVFVETLFSEDVRYHTPLFRGIFFTYAKQQGAVFSSLRRQFHLSEESLPLEGSSQPSFLHDVFDSILPRDRALVSTTAPERTKRGLKRFFGLMSGVGLVFLLAILLLRAYVIDRRLVATVDESACAERGQRGPAKPRLDEVDRCRQVVQRLIVQNQKRGWTLGFRRSLWLEEELRQRYVKKFKTDVLVPLDMVLERALHLHTDPLPLMLSLAQRVQLSRRCVSADGCPQPIVDELQPDYRLMFSPHPGQRPSPREVTKLQNTYTSYLLWQREPKAALHQDLAKDQERLQRWLSAKEFHPDQLLSWVNERVRPITYETYWELPAAITTVTAPQIEASCTRKVWERDIAPFLQQLQYAAPAAEPQLRTFQQRYLSNCFTQWQRFLVNFSQGAQRWQHRRRDLALQLLTEDSPYQRVIEGAFTNLSPWLPAEGEPDATPNWTRFLRSYMTSEQRLAYQDALKKLAAPLERDALPEASFRLAQQTFAEGQLTADAASPFLRVWGLAAQIGQTGGALQEPDENIWPSLLQEPVRYVWRVVLARASRYLQEVWEQQVVSPLRGLPPAEQVTLLYGPGGKLEGFIEQFVRPFLTGEDSGPGTVMGEGMPFSSHFMPVLRHAKQLTSVLEEGPHLVRVTATRPPRLDGQPSSLAEAVLSTTCAGKPYRVANAPTETAVSIPWSYQGCGDVSITVYLSRQGQRFPLTKRYTSSPGFLQFLKDFADGSHHFQMNDFPDADPEAWKILKYDVKAIEVYYHLQIPRSLEKLLSAVKESALPEKII